MARTATAQRVTLWVVAAVLATVAVGNQPLPGVPFGLRVVHLLVLAAIAMAGLAIATGASLRRFTTPAVWGALTLALGYVVANVLATTQSVAFGKSMKATLTLTLGVLLATAIVVAAPHGEQLRTLFAAASIGGLFVTVPTLFSGSQLETRLGGAVVNNRPTGAFSDPNELGNYCAIGLLLALGWLLASERTWEKVTAGCCAGFATVALGLSLSRGAWLGAALGLVMLAVAHPRARKPFAVAAGVLAVIVLGAVAVQAVSVQDSWQAPGPLGIVADRALSISSPSANPYDVRPITYQHAITEFCEHPWLGQGPGSFSVLQTRSDSTLQFYPRQHAHNGALTVAVEAGLVGLVPLLALLVVLVIATGRRIRLASLAGRGMLAGCAGALAAVGTHLMVDFPLRNPMLAIEVWAVVGLLIAGLASRERGQSS